MSYEEPKNGTIGVMHEQVEIDIGPEHLEGLETIVDPVVVSELPTVLWSPHGHEEAVQALLKLTDVMLIDSDDPGRAGCRAVARHGAARRRLRCRPRVAANNALARAAGSELRPAGAAGSARSDLDALTVRHRADSRGERAAAGRLVGIPARVGSRTASARRALQSENSGTVSGTAKRAGDEVTIALAPIDQEAPGLGGVTVSCAHGFSLSLDRGRGGLSAREQSPKGDETGLAGSRRLARRGRDPRRRGPAGTAA